jgi:hypothetical protein
MFNSSWRTQLHFYYSCDLLDIVAIVQNLGEPSVEVEHIVGGEAVYSLRDAVSDRVVGVME